MYTSTVLRQRELSQLATIVGDIRVAMMTTSTSDGHLISRPMMVLDFDREGAFWFFSHDDPRDLKAQARHAHLNLAFADENHAAFASVTCKGSLLHDPAMAHALWSPLVAPWFADGPDSPRLCLLRALPIVAEYWDAPPNRLVRGLALAASLVTGRPVAAGKRTVLDHIALGRQTRP